WVLDGTKTNVPAALVADTVLVPATTPEGATGVFVVAADAPGLASERQVTTTGTPEGQLELAGVRLGGDAVLGPVDEAGTVVRWTVEHATVATCAVMAAAPAPAAAGAGGGRQPPRALGPAARR